MGKKLLNRCARICRPYLDVSGYDQCADGGLLRRVLCCIFHRAVCACYFLSFHRHEELPTFTLRLHLESKAKQSAKRKPSDRAESLSNADHRNGELDDIRRPSRFLSGTSFEPLIEQMHLKTTF